MTALCGGGTSAPKLGVDAALAYSVGRIGQLLIEAGVGEFNPALPLIFTVPVIAASFCGADPPAMSALTEDEANAVINLTFGTDLTNGLGKLKDIVLNLIWNDICQCTSGTYTPATVPTTPTGVTVFQPPSLTPPSPTAQGWYPMLRSEAKIFALGCGSPVPPAGWFLPTFDDSAWITPVAPTGIFAGTWAANSNGFQNGATAALNAALPGNIEYCAPADPLAHNCEQFLIRWRVFLGDVSPASCAVRVGNAAQADGGWGTGHAFVNGFDNVAPANALAWQNFSARLLPNQWNVIALWVNSSNTSSANTWGTNGGVGLGLDFTSLQTPVHVTPCCPPDTITQSYLDLILQTVTLIQRQGVPFGYIASAVHSALSGAGSIDISGLLGASVTVTTIPDSYGRQGSAPTEYFDLGFVTFGTADGFPTSYRVSKANNVFLPARCSAYTVLDYDLAPGVVVNITELLREP